MAGNVGNPEITAAGYQPKVAYSGRKALRKSFCYEPTPVRRIYLRHLKSLLLADIETQFPITAFYQHTHKCLACLEITLV